MEEFDYETKRKNAVIYWAVAIFIGSLIVGYVVGGGMGVLVALVGFVCIPIFAPMMGTGEINAERDALAAIKKSEADIHRRDFDEKMQTMEAEHTAQSNLSKLAQSKQELIVRLGSIDQYIRVLGIETDLSKRTVALQAAHSEMTTLTAKLASGQISREAADDDDVRQQAAETSHDLARIGLADDRLNRDLFRIFKLTQPGA